MLKRVHLTAATALCGLTLGLLPLPSSHAAGRAIAQAQAGSDPGVIAWIDTSKGTALDDGTQAGTAHDLFAGTQWTFLSDHQLVISKEGKPVLTALWISNNDRTIFLIHGRSGKNTVEGTAYRNVEASSESYGDIYVNQVASDGKSALALNVHALLDLRLFKV